jgi:hypothetical protein
VEGATTARVFEAYVEKALAPSLRTGQVVVMDNLGAHRPKRIRELIEQRGWSAPARVFCPCYVAPQYILYLLVRAAEVVSLGGRVKFHPDDAMDAGRYWPGGLIRPVARTVADLIHLVARPRRAEGGSMSEERQSFWDRLFNLNYHSEREERVIEYVIHRIGDGAHLRDVLGEEYVRRNASPVEIEQILENPKLIETAHEKMRDDFSSGKLDPRTPPGGVH